MVKEVNIPDGSYMISKKYSLYPTDDQANFLDRCIDLSRYAYNWAISKIRDQEIAYNVDMAEKRRPSIIDLEKDFRIFRNENDFLKEAPYATIKMGIWRALNNYIHYDRHDNIVDIEPVYKSKKNKIVVSFTTRNNRAYFIGQYLYIEGLNNLHLPPIKSNNHTLFKSRDDNPKYFKVTISKETVLNKYWISFTTIDSRLTTYFEQNNIPKMDRAIGIDLNKNKRFVLSTGKIYYAPDKEKAEKSLKKIRRKCQKDIDRHKELEKSNPDNNVEITQSKREKARHEKLRKAYNHLANIETNFNQTVTTEIVKMNPKAIVMEDLNLYSGGMKSNKFTKGRLLGVQFRGARNMMEYKCKMYNIPFILAPDDYPSTQLCSNCGNRQNIGSNKYYKCPNCGMKMDRDINAALNLEYLAYV